MTVSIQDISNVTLAEVIRRSEVCGKPDAEAILRRMIYRSSHVRYGFIDGELACLWGIIQPTLLSECAYFWLLTTDVVQEHTFVFIRNSQRYIEAALEKWPVIIGDTHIENEKAKRWLCWLGAEYGRVDGKRISFIIRRKS